MLHKTEIKTVNYSTDNRRQVELNYNVNQPKELKLKNRNFESFYDCQRRL